LPGTLNGKLMAWLFLVAGGLFEVAFAFSLGKAREASGSPVGWYAAFAGFAIISFSLLNKSLQHIPLGTALLGIFFFRDPITFWRLFFLSTLVASVVGLKFASH
jgi:quaternary ammonium compound-resistance protein SugE